MHVDAYCLVISECYTSIGGRIVASLIRASRRPRKSIVGSVFSGTPNPGNDSTSSIHGSRSNQWNHIYQGELGLRANDFFSL